jgi:hypothetical protein
MCFIESANIGLVICRSNFGAKVLTSVKGEPLGSRGEGPLIKVDLPRRRRAGTAENGGT